MSAKKGRGAKVPAGPPDQRQASSRDVAEAPNVSAIDKTSFLEALQLNDGNPLHSTAMEEELNVLEEGRVDRGKAGRPNDPRTLKAKQRGAAAKRKATETDEENGEEEEKKRTRRSTGEKVKARPDKGGERKKKKAEPEVPVGAVSSSDADSTPHTSSQPASRANRHLVGKKPAKRRSAGKTTAVRPLKRQQTTKDTKRRSESDIEKSNDPESQEESDTGADQQSRKRVLSSDEEVEEEKSWKPSPKEARVYRFVSSRKSSSGSASAGAGRSDTDKQRSKRPARQAGTNLEVVLDAFLDFCDQYRESVESKAVKQSIDSFSSHVKEQLLEKISSDKELRVLKRENAKVGSLIRTKTQRMLDAKHELMRAERQVWQLQKESAELKLRLADLKKSRVFLHDIRELNQQYLDHRHKRPKERETYGASSLAALMLETKHIQAAEQHLKGINDRMEKRQKESGICK
ncbi:centromere protein U [Scophthalmus maximus]|uniref:Centromere protein U n=1 Tax=Scophthalmus maximus TaxID=52904 RepID=A0A8D3AUT1_SCOMX|nr:centromere protein U [Scophthalmus maximus]